MDNIFVENVKFVFSVISENPIPIDRPTVIVAICSMVLSDFCGHVFHRGNQQGFLDAPLVVICNFYFHREFYGLVRNNSIFLSLIQVTNFYKRVLQWKRRWIDSSRLVGEEVCDVFMELGVAGGIPQTGSVVNAITP